MAAAEPAVAEGRDLESELLDVGNKLSSPPSDVEELLSLLNLAESILSRVKQRPSDSTCGALHPIMKALVAEGLMNHSEMDVKVALASCFSEITRISAPSDPYCENLMKAILRIIVDALTDIDDLSSRSHGKKVSILETITVTHSFFMLLDLECDDLILELFHHFLKTARQVNDGRVLSFMETMMTELLNESEDILLSRLLDFVVKDIKDGLPIPSRLGEKVIGSCAEKLKPYLIILVRSDGASFNDYGDIIASICQENSDMSELNKPSTSDECLITPVLEGSSCIQDPVDEPDHQHPETNLEPEHKLLEKNMITLVQEESCHIQGPVDVLDHQLPETNLEPEHKPLQTNTITLVQEGSCHIQGPVNVPDHQLPETNMELEHKLLQTNTESGRLEQEVDCTNNSVAEKTIQEITRRSSRKIVKRKFFEVENSKSEKQKKNTKKIDLAVKKILKKCGETCTSKSVRKLTKREASDLQNSIIEKLTGELIIIDDLAEEQSPKITLVQEESCHIQGPVDVPDHQLLETDHQLLETNLEPEHILLQTKTITLVQDGSCHIQGPVDMLDHQLPETNLEPEHKLLQTNTESGRLEQEVDCQNNSEAEKTFQEIMRRSSRKIVKRKFFKVENSKSEKQKKNTKKIDLAAKKILKKCGETCTSKSVRKFTKREASDLQKSLIEKLTGELIIIDDLAGEQSPKALDKDQSNLAESSKATSRRKPRRKPTTKVNDEGFEAENHRKELEGVLVGKKIKVWWPIDEVFYEGVIDSFDPVSKKHKVVYADGDEEELLLKDEYWIDLEDTTRRDLVYLQENEPRRLDASPEMSILG